MYFRITYLCWRFCFSHYFLLRLFTGTHTCVCVVWSS